VQNFLFSEYQQEKNNWTIALLAIDAANFPVKDLQLIPSHLSSSPEQPPEL